MQSQFIIVYSYTLTHGKQVLPKVIWEERVATPCRRMHSLTACASCSCTMRNETLRSVTGRLGTVTRRYGTLRKRYRALTERYGTVTENIDFAHD